MAFPTTNLSPEQLQALLLGPAGMPPPGVTPNFDNPPSLLHFVIPTIVLCTLPAAIAVALRMYTKFFIMRSMAYEDYTILVAWIGQIIETIPSALTARYGAGVNIWNVRLESVFRMLYYVNIAAIIYPPVIFFVKLSLLQQYLRIFCPNRNVNKFTGYGAEICIVIIFLFYVLNTIFQAIRCLPRERIWNLLLTHGHCLDQNKLYLATGIFNFVSDFAILILPIPAIWRLKLPLSKKLGVAFIFSAGALACITSAIRIYYSLEISQTPDLTYRIAQIGLWTWAEIAIGIIVTCLPTLPRFFQEIGPRISTFFSSNPKSDKKPSSISNLFRLNRFTNVFTGFKRNAPKRTVASTSKSLADKRKMQTKLDDEHIALTEREPKLTERTTTSGSIQSFDSQQMIRQADLEYGLQGIRVDWEARAEFGPNTDNVHAIGGTGDHKVLGW